MAVVKVQPLAVSNPPNCDSPEYSVSVPVLRYPISIAGKTISLAGKPKRKPVIIVPSRPVNSPNGFKKEII